MFVHSGNSTSKQVFFDLLLDIDRPCHMVPKDEDISGQWNKRQMSYYDHRDHLCATRFDREIEPMIKLFKDCLPTKEKRDLSLVPFVGDALQVIRVVGVGVTNLLTSVFGTSEGNLDASVHRLNTARARNEAELMMQEEYMANSALEELKEVSFSAKRHLAEAREVVKSIPKSIEAMYRTYIELYASKANLMAIYNKCKKRQVATFELGELLGTNLLDGIEPEDTVLEKIEVDEKQHTLRFHFHSKSHDITVDYSGSFSRIEVALMILSIFLFLTIVCIIACFIMWIKKEMSNIIGPPVPARNANEMVCMEEVRQTSGYDDPDKYTKIKQEEAKNSNKNVGN